MDRPCHQRSHEERLGFIAVDKQLSPRFRSKVI